MKKDLTASLQRVLTQPDPAVLWSLRADLLEAGVPADSPVWSLVDEFHGFLEHLVESSTAREFSNLASILDIGGVGGVIIENLLEAEESEKLARRLLGAVLSEGLMILATRQHVKAWEVELDSVYRAAVWSLYPRIWRFSEIEKPDLPQSERRALLEQLFEPLMDPTRSGTVRAVVIVRLFQALLLQACQDRLA